MASNPRDIPRFSPKAERKQSGHKPQTEAEGGLARDRPAAFTLLPCRSKLAATAVILDLALPRSRSPLSALNLPFAATSNRPQRDGHRRPVYGTLVSSDGINRAFDLPFRLWCVTGPILLVLACTRQIRHTSARGKRVDMAFGSRGDFIHPLDRRARPKDDIPPPRRPPLHRSSRGNLVIAAMGLRASYQQFFDGLEHVRMARVDHVERAAMPTRRHLRPVGLLAQCCASSASRRSKLVAATRRISTRSAKATCSAGLLRWHSHAAKASVLYCSYAMP